MRVGDPTLLIQVTQQDINSHVNQDVYKTSLGLAVLRQVTGVNSAAVSLGEIRIQIEGISYNLDVQSVAFCNAEVAGISVTIPYTATLTYATLI